MEEEEHYAEEEEYEEDLFDVEEISNIIKYNIEQNLGIQYRYYRATSLSCI